MRMFVNVLLIVISLNVCITKCAVFLWSNKRLDLSPLQPFNTEHFTKLIEQLENPKVYTFKSSTSNLSPDFKDIIHGYYSAYNPNGYIDVENATDLLGDSKLDIAKVKKILNEREITTNILSVIVIPNRRYKRQLSGDDTGLSSTVPTNDKTSKSTLLNKGSVIYQGQNSNNKLYALLYSSRPLLFKTNDTESIEYHLGRTDADMIIYDTRLNVNVIPLEGGSKITLRFSFSWLNGYWSLPSVKVTDTSTNRDFNLTTDENIMAPAHFSYHCNGHTVFSDQNGTELYIYDIQVQTDSKNGKFGDANDCVSFTTAPIWSGLFVTTLLGIGLIVALTAIMDIKTMDKFDNHKTKNLSITVSD